MLKKDEKYSYEDIENIIDKGITKALANMSEEFSKVLKEKGKEADPMQSFSFSMQNMMAMSELKKVLLEEEV